MSANPNPEVNGWCPTCREWSVRGRQDQCMWCESPLVDRPAGPEPRPAVEPQRRAGRSAPTKRPALAFSRPQKITEEVIAEAYRLYTEERDERRKPLSLRAVGKLIFERTDYASPAACANALCDHWRYRGWPLRDRIAATKEATITHGELVGTRDWTSPEARARREAYKKRRRRHVRCEGTTAKGKPCTAFAQDGKTVCAAHDPERQLERELQLAQMRVRHLENSLAREQTRLDQLEAQTHNEGSGNAARNHQHRLDDVGAGSPLARTGERGRGAA